MTCPLCLNKTIDFYHQDKFRDYWQCSICQLVFVKPEYHLNATQEKKVYDLHQNNSMDSGYRKFLNKLIIPFLGKLTQKMLGLDFGSGPGPTISVMLGEQGIRVENYDIFYNDKPELLDQTYDFITSTEVIEHLFNPNKVISMFTTMLKPNGLLGIMTKRVINKEKFNNWHYKNDLTHVCFYSDETFDFIAKQWGYKLELVDTDAVILTKHC